MSHFSVMVIGPNPDDQLAPYHEFECTSRNDQYVKDVDITDEFRAVMDDADPGEDPLERALDYYGYSAITHEDEADRHDAHKWGFVVVQDNTVVRAVKRTNPVARWDWYVVGGRWTGFLRLHPGRTGLTGSPGIMTDEAPEGHVDQARHGDIDWGGMRAKAGNEAARLWDRVRELSPALWTSWDSIRSDHPDDIDMARRVYSAQLGRQALSFDQDLQWCNDDVLVSREEYVSRARQRAVVTYAVVRNGEWFQRGRMGWWGMSRDEMPESEWHALVNQLVDGLDPDTLITIVDCHI
jgi:hypothetical protein